MADRKEFLRSEDMTPEFLADLIDESNTPHREVLDFVQRVPHPPVPQMPRGAILIRHATRNVGRLASITGFADRSIPIGPDEYRETMLEPFHLKNAAMYGIEHAAYLLQGGEPTLEETEAGRATQNLEGARLNKVVEACVAMMDAQAFTYMDADTLDNSRIYVAVDYTGEITALPDAGSYSGSSGDLAAASPKTLYEYRKMKSGYRAAQGIDFPPNVMFINPETAARLLGNADIIKTYTPLGSGDPDQRGATYDGFVFDGIMHIVWHHEYQTPTGLAPAVADGYGLLTVDRDPITGDLPIAWHAAATKLNGNDGAQAYFDGLVGRAGENPEIGIRMYDNGIPAPTRRNMIRKVKLFT